MNKLEEYTRKIDEFLDLKIIQQRYEQVREALQASEHTFLFEEAQDRSQSVQQNLIKLSKIEVKPPGIVKLVTQIVFSFSFPEDYEKSSSVKE